MSHLAAGSNPHRARLFHVDRSGNKVSNGPHGCRRHVEGRALGPSFGAEDECSTGCIHGDFREALEDSRSRPVTECTRRRCRHYTVTTHQL